MNAFRLLPTLEECDGRQWSAREWSKTRRGWIFITSRETTRDIQRPLMSIWIDTLLLRLMSKSPDGKPPKPVWLIIRPRVITLENVEEFESWSRIRNGRPDLNWGTQLSGGGANVVRATTERRPHATGSFP